MDLTQRLTHLRALSRVADCELHLHFFGDMVFGNKGPYSNPSPGYLGAYIEQFRDVIDSDDAIPPHIVPRYTGVLDAARTLIPKRWFWTVSNAAPPPHNGRATLHNRQVSASHFGVELNSERESITVVAFTPEIALCLACVKAKAVLERASVP